MIVLNDFMCSWSIPRPVLCRMLTTFTRHIGASIFNLAQNESNDPEMATFIEAYLGNDITSSVKEQSRTYKGWYDELKWFSMSVDQLDFNPLSRAKVLLQATANIDRIKSKLSPTAITFEATEIEAEVKTVMERITQELSEKYPQCAVTPVLRGSVLEGCTAFYPNEFDYILHCTGLQKWVKCEQLSIDNCYVAKAKADEELIESMAMFIDNDGCVNKNAYVHDLYVKFGDIAELYYKTQTTPRKMLPQKTSAKEIGHIIYDWRGNVFKDLKIKIDLVPSLKIESDIYVIAKSSRHPWGPPSDTTWMKSLCEREHNLYAVSHHMPDRVTSLLKVYALQDFTHKALSKHWRQKSTARKTI